MYRSLVVWSIISYGRNVRHIFFSVYGIENFHLFWNEIKLVIIRLNYLWMKENYLHLCDSILFNTFRVEMGKNVLILEENFNSIQYILFRLIQSNKDFINLKRVTAQWINDNNKVTNQRFSIYRNGCRKTKHLQVGVPV